MASPSSSTKLAVLSSGNFHILQALGDAIRYKVLNAELALVLSQVAEANGLTWAQKLKIPTTVHALQPYLSDGRCHSDYEVDMAALLKDYGPNYIVLDGWTSAFSLNFLDEFPYRVVNIHPSMPGKFTGATAIEDAFQAFERGEIKETGVTAHLVLDEQTSTGPVLGSQNVPIYPSDTITMLENRIHRAGHTLLIRTLDRLIHGDE